MSFKVPYNTFFDRETPIIISSLYKYFEHVNLEDYLARDLVLF